MGKPQELRHLTYTTYAPLLRSIEAMREPLRELAEVVDDLEGVIAYDHPEQRRVDAALAAAARLPGVFNAVEEALAPRKVETLRRRLFRALTGEKMQRASRRRR